MIDRKTLAAIRPATDGKTHFLPDGAVGGLGVLWGATGKPSWTLAYRVGGRQIRAKLGFVWTGIKGQEPPGWLSIDGARAEAYRRKEAGEAGLSVAEPKTSPAVATAAGKRFEDVLVEYLDAKAPRSRRDIDRMIRHDCPALLSRPLASITYQETDAIVQAVINRGSKIAARNLHLQLKACFNWAMKRRLISEIPMVGDAPERAQERERILSDCELAKIWRATEDRPLPLRGVVRTLILTGQRRENAAGMRWSELDESERLWTIPAARFKTGVVQVIPTDTIAGILGEQPRIVGSDFVFTFSGSKSADVSKESAKLRKLSGVDDWTLHDLRRTAITNWGKLRIDREVRDRLSHPPTAGVGRTYNRYEFLDEKREALAKWSEHVAGLIAEARSVGLASARRMAPTAG